MKEPAKDELSSSRLDDSKCKKGHSYVETKLNGGSLIRSEWKCRKCGRELNQK
jgi:hypothetical protein